MAQDRYRLLSSRSVLRLQRHFEGLVIWPLGVYGLAV